MAERIDNLMHTGLKIIQDDQYFSFGIDAVLLSRFVNVHNHEKVIDLGTGNGVIPLMLTTRQKNIHITGLEIQSAVADIARKSVKLNGLTNTIEIITGDLKEIKDLFKSEQFDLVVANPPYLPIGEGLERRLSAHAVARHEINCKLDEVIGACRYLSRYGGRICLVYRAVRLVELIKLLHDHNLEPKRLLLVQSNISSEPHIFLVEAIKGAKPGLRVLPTLIMYENHQYTQQMTDYCFPGGQL